MSARFGLDGDTNAVAFIGNFDNFDDLDAHVAKNELNYWWLMEEGDLNEYIDSAVSAIVECSKDKSANDKEDLYFGLDTDNQDVDYLGSHDRHQDASEVGKFDYFWIFSIQELIVFMSTAREAIRISNEA